MTDTNHSSTSGAIPALDVPAGSAEVLAALQWVEVDPLDNPAVDAAHAAMSRLTGLREYWPLNSAPARILDSAAAAILAKEVRRLQGRPNVSGLPRR